MDIFGYRYLPQPNRISPREFLEWATPDFRGGGARGIGNSLSNIKRAIHARIDEILSLTRLSYSKDWNSRASTEEKLQCLKILGIQYRAIVSLLTKIRNRYEHEYVIPSQEEAALYLEIAELWLEKSYRQYHVFSVALSKIPTGNFGVFRKDTEQRITSLSFTASIEAMFFDDRRKRLVQIDRKGREKVRKYASFVWKDLLRLESNALRPVIENKPNSQVSSTLLTVKNVEFVFKSYRDHLKGTFIEF